MVKILKRRWLKVVVSNPSFGGSSSPHVFSLLFCYHGFNLFAPDCDVNMLFLSENYLGLVWERQQRCVFLTSLSWQTVISRCICVYVRCFSRTQSFHTFNCLSVAKESGNTEVMKHIMYCVGTSVGCVHDTWQRQDVCFIFLVSFIISLDISIEVIM